MEVEPASSASVSVGGIGEMCGIMEGDHQQVAVMG